MIFGFLGTAHFILCDVCFSLVRGMLVREPDDRAGLDQILTHRWLALREGECSIVVTPLVSRQHLAEDDHAYILQRMVSGKIAAKDDIFR